ncbi:DUF7738 domain-containing protein [Melittangium boletus]|uniref:DUF7738 domain-containing protein n=1 Tax=Melittangium boletus TaxID=83453 RepID=UPI003DA3114A
MGDESPLLGEVWPHVPAAERVPGVKAPPPPSPGTATSPLLTVDGTAVRYNGQLLDWGNTERWRQVLGPPSREHEGILTWDELGLFLHDKNDQSPGPESLEVLLGRTMHSPLTQGEPESWPHKLFPGRLFVDGGPVTSKSDINDINRDKKGKSFGRDYMSGVYSYNLGEFYLRLDYGHDRSLTVFSITQ